MMMPRVALAERTLELSCEGAGSAWYGQLDLYGGGVRGHGRFWLGHAHERDVVVIAHRVAFALVHGIDALTRYQYAASQRAEEIAAELSAMATAQNVISLDERRRGSTS
jgi:hypothetical protein